MEISTLNFRIKNKDVLNTTFSGNETLLDSDVVICNTPNINEDWGRVSLGKDNKYYLRSPDSLKLQEHLSHRKNEIKTLLENGKVIVCFLGAPIIVYGEGKRVNIYNEISNYSFLPIDEHSYPILQSIMVGQGRKKSGLKLTENKNPFAQFYHAFKNELSYQAYFDFPTNEDFNSFIQNKSKKGLGLTLKVLNGHVIFLPKLSNDIDQDKLIGVIRTCSQNIMKSAKEITPRPKWLKDYELRGEVELLEKIEEVEAKIRDLKDVKSEFQRQIQKVVQYKKLLFEQGEELELVVKESFKLMGFDVEKRKEEDIEHDLLFSSAEGRGLAEVEGKDSTAINISKFDQLNRAVDEDFHINDDYPQGILIGNHFRLENPITRKEPFTEKVHTIARKKSFGLLTTLEIYNAVAFILKNPDDNEFKKQCRYRILNTEGEIIKLID